MKLSELAPVPNSHIISAKIASELVKSVSFWPENTGLQIDLLASVDKEFYILLTQLGDDFPDWTDDVVDIIQDIGELETLTKRDVTQLFKDNEPSYMYELVPYSEIPHFRADDFNFAAEQASEDSVFYNQDDLDDIEERYIRNRMTIPETRYLEIGKLIHKMMHEPGTSIRTTLRPVEASRADEVREEVFTSDHRLIGTLDANASVVDTRCFVGSKYSDVTVGTKRLFNSMATDSALTKIQSGDVANIWRNSLEVVNNYSRISLTAAAMVRIPVVEGAPVKQAGKALKSIQKNMMLHDILKHEIEETVLQKVDEKLEALAEHLDDAIHKEIAETFREVLMNSFFEPPELETVTTPSASKFANQPNNDELIPKVKKSQKATPTSKQT
ncbi:MAG: hypothetical protein Ta2B_13930 [Termitinemataceae bacterium]|nr:MAG: hypothetical protein Ta2B_13930 [Termitinemataceae bacterium]